jgi:phage shock protein C
MEDAEMDDRLYRSTDDRMLAGVAGGLAEMWDADPSVIRLVWAFLALFTGGIALVVYIVMAIVVPERPDDWSAATVVATPGAPGAAATGAAAAGTAAASRAEARAARRAARAARRAERRRRGPSTVGIVVGGLLIVVGAVYLVRQWLPEFGFDWVWPVVLIALGVLLLISAVERDHGPAGVPPTPPAPGSPDPSGTSGGPA